MATQVFSKSNIRAFFLFAVLLFFASIIKDTIVRSFAALNSGDYLGAALIGLIAYTVWYLFFKR